MTLIFLTSSSQFILLSCTFIKISEDLRHNPILIIFCQTFFFLGGGNQELGNLLSSVFLESFIHPVIFYLVGSGTRGWVCGGGGSWICSCLYSDPSRRRFRTTGRRGAEPSSNLPRSSRYQHYHQPSCNNNSLNHQRKYFQKFRIFDIF